MNFRLLSPIRKVENIAYGYGIRNLKRLNKFYGKSKWRKMKGFAKIQLEDGAIVDAELHWYEGHGIGKKEIKIKRYI